MDNFKNTKLKGVSGLVEVNEDGSIVKFNNKVLKQHCIKGARNSQGYNAVSIKGRSFYVHRIVAMAFIPNRKPITHKYVLHINDLSDNHYKNLKWGTDKDLYKKNLLLKKQMGGKYRGSSSISYEDAIKIAKRLDNGEFAKDISVEYGVSEMSIARIRKRYCKSKTSSPRYDKDIKSIVMKLSKKNMTASDIARVTGLKYHTVYRWLRNKENIIKDKPVFYY